MPRAVWEPVVKQEVKEEKAHDMSFANVIWTAADGLEAFEADDDGDEGEDDDGDDDGGINFGRPEFRGARFDTGNFGFPFPDPDAVMSAYLGNLQTWYHAKKVHLSQSQHCLFLRLGTNVTLL